MTLTTVDLQPGERIVWTGTPAKSPLIDPTEIVRTAFYFIFCVFAFAWALIAWRNNESPLYLGVGVLIIAIGIYYSIGRIFLRRRYLRTTQYVITDRRALTVSRPLGFRRMRARQLAELRPPVMTQVDGNVGTIQFGEEDMIGGWRVYTRRGMIGERFVFLYVPDVQRVCQLIAQTMVSGQNPSGI